MLVIEVLVVALLIESSTCYTAEEQDEIVHSHNEYRKHAKPKAGDMRRLVWDDEVANMAEYWVSTCPTDHNPNRNNYGENIAFSTVPFEGDMLLIGIDRWYDEVKDYKYKEGACTGVCGHYTQVEDARSLKVGCARNLDPCVNNKYPYVFVCNYDPAGNMVGEKPYSVGKPCSRCHDDAKYCDADGFCSDCTPGSGDCECKRICANGGTLNEEDCSCTCDTSSGYWGSLCTDKCENSASCDQYLTWDNSIVCANDYFYNSCALKCQPDCQSS
ncbi:cysteine-rich venom protein-like [Antedon mediterranea]|uniref:cysteine-rich venom protein-like n=1 Tax=Antedon mediterranea TaxID=105859 RepID=UPI003AF6BE0B